MTTMKPSVAEEQRDALGERLFASLLGGMELVAVELGLRLGLYRALRDGGPATASQLGSRAGIDERYAREWLEQQAVAGLLEVSEPGEDPGQRRYALPAGHAEALLDPDSPGCAAAALSLVGLTKVIDALTDAYRTGQGVAYARYGAEVRDGIAGLNRPMFSNDLASRWLAALPDVHERLQAGEAVRVLDVG